MGREAKRTEDGLRYRQHPTPHHPRLSQWHDHAAQVNRAHIQSSKIKFGGRLVGKICTRHLGQGVPSLDGTDDLDDRWHPVANGSASKASVLGWKHARRAALRPGLGFLRETTLPKTRRSNDEPSDYNRHERNEVDRRHSRTDADNARFHVGAEKINIDS
ncbi:hypothetical protein KM043_008116 [Ampulex compressa]|nr:hypothetical protein KM043_008116 [Ampulex compressa]